jgi:D-xylose 1-dehydrogenase (NADP+, D-xylono-1,5-lactone-forming)
MEAVEAKVLGWGLLGTARINRALIPPLKVSARNRVLAVASRRADAAEAYAREWDIPRAHGSYEALLADPAVDVVYNPLPNGYHAEWTIKAVRAGKHVLCEKPLALSTAEVDAIVAAASKHGKVVAEAFMYRHHPQTPRVKEMVQSGAIGRLLLVRGSFSFTLNREGDVRLDPKMGDGSLWDVGCYPLSFARFVTGAEPLEVFGWQQTGPTGIDDTFAGQLRFPGGVLAQLDCSFRAPFRTEMELVGTEGTLRVPAPFKPGPDAVIHLHRGDAVETLASGDPDLYIHEVEDLADAVILGKAPRVSLADSRGNTAAIVALLESARAGRPITP